MGIYDDIGRKLYCANRQSIPLKEVFIIVQFILVVPRIPPKVLNRLISANLLRLG